MELIQIVDEYGQFTGQVLEREEAHAKNLLHNEVSIFIINDKKQVLLQKRSANKKMSPNKWGLCSGHVAANESIEEAALRELQEEVGLDISKKDLYPLAKPLVMISNTASRIANHYYVKTTKKERRLYYPKRRIIRGKMV